ncbi:zinc-binding dehydrogenase [Kribbella qitaiheensis]|uniref:Zinc-binding dehydrogenase n=1 Tax=Kribbella qitaiheensis TaxID=1544730 RepID=A0A7G6X7A0_9ACTN|nr:zinc-binding dehydrogenase [Kribbella qitaiheensis]
MQLAVASGARVTAQVSGSGRIEEAYELGAHRVITSLEEESVGPFHLVLDGIGGPLLAQAIRRMAPGGHLAWYGNVGGVAELKLSDFFGHAQAWNALYEVRPC